MHVPLIRVRSDNPTFHALDSLKDKQVLLLDDTFTTGSSITAAHRALTRVGADLLTPWSLGGTSIQPTTPARAFTLV
ncbi:MAG: hypothetical protein F4Y27_01735 [Acidimicrobiaceae bacterium]|nr:hypothetical protein [Acidimicrobiaceae bacterium]MYG54825.1 hypothetical protein [Acidimicrobiaceae bacterium]MYJ99223.1 hypothetical protein [Acidimicrobiaceae bacterium]